MSRDRYDNSTDDPLRQAETRIELDDGQMVRWIGASRRRNGAVWFRRRLTMMVVAMMALILAFTGGPKDPLWRRLTPMVLITGVLVGSWVFSHMIRRVRLLYGRVMTHMQLRQWPAAMEALNTLMSRPIDSPDARAAALLASAELATRAGSHDAAVAAFDEILAKPASAEYVQRALAEKALALLRSRRLTEATSLLDSFRNVEFAEPAATLVAMGGMYRRIQTRNFEAVAAEADAIAERARDVFRRHAAYAYGLVALALDEVGQPQRAQAYYDCATRLMSPDELVLRFAELAQLSERLCPARSPL